MGERTQAQGWGPVRIGLWAALVLAVIWGVVLTVPGAVSLGSLADARPQFDPEPFWRAPPLVQVHLATVLLALVLGPIQLVMPKGTPGHRLLGWVWATAMMTTAVVTLFIREINHGALSPIHFFSFWTLVSLPLGIWFAKRGLVGAHRGSMVGLYIGLVIAGILSIGPGRLTWEIFFG